MPGVTVELLLIFLLIVANGVFSMSEIAVVSARKARLLQRATAGDARARAALELANSPNQFLSTVQIGISLVGTLAGAFGGAALAKPLTLALQGIPAVAPYASTLALVSVVLGITYLSVVVGELVPKRLALNNPDGIAAMMAGPMRRLSAITAPVVFLLSASTDLILRLFGVRQTVEAPITEEELRIHIRQATEAGVLEDAEQELVQKVFRLADQRVAALMTPRREVEFLDVQDPPEENRQRVLNCRYSRLIVCDGTIDTVLGVVQVKDVLAQCAAGAPVDFRAACREPLFVPESKRALRALEAFQQSRTHLAVVVDEYGGFQGVVTLTDILEGIVGELPAAGHDPEPAAVQREDGSWLLDGMLPIHELRDLLTLSELPGEDSNTYDTLGGFVLTQLGRVPSAGDHFTWGGHRFEVMDMDGRRIDKVLVAATEG